MLFTCAPRAPASESGTGPRPGRQAGPPTVDIHCHKHSERAEAALGSARPDHDFFRFGNELTLGINRRQSEQIAPKMSSEALRLADMDAMGIDIQAISPSPEQYYYWTEPDLGRAASRAFNDHMAEIVAANPDHFVGIGTVPLQDTQMAITELVRCVKKLDLRGVELATNVNGEELSQPRLEPFFAKAEELNILIFLHPAGFTQPGRLSDHYLNNLIGNPLESTLAISHLIFGGVLDRYPGLKICIAHGGGCLPAYAGRMDHGFHARGDCREHIARTPSTYLKQLYFDTMVFETDQLAFLVEKYGADHILLGTDYPFDMGESDPLGLIGRLDELSEADQGAISGGNALRLLGL